jgi:hypothetical protein
LEASVAFQGTPLGGTAVRWQRDDVVPQDPCAATVHLAVDVHQFGQQLLYERGLGDSSVPGFPSGKLRGDLPQQLHERPSLSKMLGDW